MDFAGSHIAVTGASSGIGLVTAKLLASRGARVSLIARRREALDQAASEIGPNAAGFAADVGRKDQLDAALDAAAMHFGPVQGVFANAGLTGGFTPAVAFATKTRSCGSALTNRASSVLASSSSGSNSRTRN